MIFTKAIHVGQVVRNKTNINKGSVSIGSAAVDLAEKHLGDLTGKSVLVVGAGKMGKLVAKALAEKNLNAIFVANRTFYVAVELAEDLDGTAILFSQLDDYLKGADLVISATSAPHKLFNIDDLREIADYNTKLRVKEFDEAEIIINEEYHLLKESFKIMEVDDLLSSLRISMEEIRQRETKKASSKLSDVDGSSKIINNLTNSIVNKIFFDISQNLKQAAAEDKQEVLKSAEYIFDFNHK